MNKKMASDQSINYLQIINHPRVHELSRIINFPIQAEDLKEQTQIESTEIPQINLAAPA